MKINDEVEITGGNYKGCTAYYLDEVARSFPSVSNVQLKSTKEEVKVYTDQLKPVEQRSVNDYFKRINLEWKTVNIHPNDSKETEQVHVSTAKDGFTLKGREQIEEFIRAVAIAGDLIAEDEELVVKHKIKFEVPEDGTYSLVPKSGVPTVIFVIKGEFYTASKGTGLPYRATTYVKAKVEGEGAELKKLDVTGQW